MNRIRYISDVNEINEHIKYCYEYRELVFRQKRKDETFGVKAFIEDNEVNFTITYKKGTKPCSYVFRKDGEDKQKISGCEAYRILSKYCKIPKMDDAICGRYEDGGMSASPLLWYNKELSGKRYDAIGYDLNSAYSNAMLQPMPDTSFKPRAKRIVEGCEIGFKEVMVKLEKGERMALVPMYKGYSLYVFPLMPSPFKKFVNTWYDKKKNAKTKQEKNKAKNVLNYCVGYLQLKNPFIRATIVGACNKIMENLIDENTLYCNTDCIVSLKERDDLPVGTEIGQFKIENRGKFAYKGLNYQWNNELPSYRGVCKSWFKEGWDILKDPLPDAGNIYKFNKEKGLMEEIDYEA